MRRIVFTAVMLCLMFVPAVGATGDEKTTEEQLAILYEAVLNASKAIANSPLTPHQRLVISDMLRNSVKKSEQVQARKLKEYKKNHKNYHKDTLSGYDELVAYVGDQKKKIKCGLGSAPTPDRAHSQH